MHASWPPHPKISCLRHRLLPHLNVVRCRFPKGGAPVCSWITASRLAPSFLFVLPKLSESVLKCCSCFILCLTGNTKLSVLHITAQVSHRRSRTSMLGVNALKQLLLPSAYIMDLHKLFTVRGVKWKPDCSNASAEDAERGRLKRQTQSVPQHKHKPPKGKQTTNMTWG